MGGRSPPDPLRFGNALNVGSSTGWTDEKHVRYITSLEESFVNQLHNREFNSKGMFCQSPEGYWGTLETDGAESRSSQIEYVGSPCSGFQENSIAYYMDSDTSANFPQHERTSNASRSKNSGRFVASYSSQWNRNSLPRTAAESSGQNFVDGEAEGTHEHSKGCRKRRQKQKAAASYSREVQGPK